jgi:pimeloyl-ACP methyl ester carboxylesterase
MALAVCVSTVLAGCATVSARYDARARALGFARGEVTGTDFRHTVYARTSPAPRHVRVYLEGDGTPWVGGRTIASDPTSRRAFALELMARDAGDVLLVGRPCYHGRETAPACTPALWTDARYSEAVVASLAAALEAALRCCSEASATLVGYSGGGVLATLVAARSDRVVRVLTVGANLDVDAWTRLHGYLPLARSLDPSRLPAVAPRFDEVHLTGARDRNVPAAIAEAYASARPWVRVERFETYDHVCCWAQAWPEIVARYDAPPR